VPPDELNLIPIQSIRDPRVADYSGLKDAQLRALAAGPGQEPGVFLAEGELVVRELIASPMHVRSVLLTPGRIAAMTDALVRLPEGVPLYVAQQGVMDEVVGFHIHRGILAAGVRPPPPDLDALLAGAGSLVILEDLTNHDNVGGIFRAAAALAGVGGRGGGAVLLSPRCCDPLYRKAIRVSMGMALRVPFARLAPWPEGLRVVRAAGFTVVALTPSPGAVSMGELRPTTIGRPAVLLGSEGPGLTHAAMEEADLRVRIPIDPAVDSLNVVVAAGIALANLCRPRPE